LKVSQSASWARATARIVAAAASLNMVGRLGSESGSESD
jgi:hypothetical protein